MASTNMNLAFSQDTPASEILGTLKKLVHLYELQAELENSNPIEQYMVTKSYRNSSSKHEETISISRKFNALHEAENWAHRDDETIGKEYHWSLSSGVQFNGAFLDSKIEKL